MDNVVIAITLLESTGEYVSKSIEGKTDREAYLEAHRMLIDAFEGAREHGYDRLKYLMRVGNEFKHTRKFRRSLFSDPNKYYNMAFLHATEIVDSIEKRFV
jgi:hypothetical protein